MGKNQGKEEREKINERKKGRIRIYTCRDSILTWQEYFRRDNTKDMLLG